MLNQELLHILACPKCKGPVTLTEKNDGLVCQICCLVYEIRDDIPIMLIDEAKPIEAPHPAFGGGLSSSNLVEP